MTAQIICLADHRRPRRHIGRTKRVVLDRERAPSTLPPAHPFVLFMASIIIGAAFVTVMLKGPGGIDDLEIR